MLNYNQFSRAGGQEPFCRWRNKETERDILFGALSLGMSRRERSK